MAILGDGADIPGPTFSGPSEATIGEVTSTLSSNVLGSTDGHIDFEITTGNFWPVYGARLLLSIP